MLLAGNRQVKEILLKDFKEGRIASSYLFIGPEGVGKKLFAVWFAKLLICKEKGEVPCGRCSNCLKVEKGIHPDVIVIEPEIEEGKKLVVPTIKIDEIRELVVNQSNFKPWEASKRIFIIDEAHMLTEEAQNLLLKTLEEPPEGVIIILITHLEGNLLPTVLSRLRKVEFGYIKKEEVESFLRESLFDSGKLLDYFDGTISWLFKLNELGIDKISEIFQRINEARMSGDWHEFFDIIERIARGDFFERKFITCFLKYILFEKRKLLKKGLIDEKDYKEYLNFFESLYKQHDVRFVLTRMFL